MLDGGRCDRRKYPEEFILFNLYNNYGDLPRIATFWLRLGLTSVLRFAIELLTPEDCHILAKVGMDFHFEQSRRFQDGLVVH